MTTRRHVIRREWMSEWPAFTGREIPHNIGVLSLELRRTPHEKMAEAVAQASATLLSGLTHALELRHYKLWLLCLGRPVQSSSRVAAYHAERDRLWGELEKAKVGLPNGPRIEVRVEYGTDFGFAGSIELGPGDFPVALEVTRVENAVCVGAESFASNPVTRLFRSPLKSVEGRPPALLPLAIELLPDYVFLARGFGQFDDVVVGAEVFALGPYLDALERALGVS